MTWDLEAGAEVRTDRDTVDKCSGRRGRRPHSATDPLCDLAKSHPSRASVDGYEQVEPKGHAPHKWPGGLREN